MACRAARLALSFVVLGACGRGPAAPDSESETETESESESESEPETESESESEPETESESESEPETESESEPETESESEPETETESETEPATPDPACTHDGCLRAVTPLGDYAKTTLEAVLAPGVHIDNGYSVFTIAFWSAGAEIRATVAIPYGVPAPVNGFHIVANHHGTTGLDDPCTIVDTLAGAGLAGLFGARGMIGVAPEYPGIGSPGVHPYLVADAEARLAFDALRATRAFATSRARSPASGSAADPRRAFARSALPLSGRYALVGLSQGGHVTLAAAARHRQLAPELDVRAFAVAAPATVWEEHWRAGLAFDGPHLVYDAMLVHAWAHHYGYAGPSLWEPALAPRIDALMRDHCAWFPRGDPALATLLPTTASALFSADFLAAFQTGTWGPTFALFGAAFAANRVGPYDQTAPLKIYQGDADTSVPAYATTAVVTALRAGGVVVDYELVPGAGHLDTAFGFVASLEARTDASIAWVRARLDE